MCVRCPGWLYRSVCVLISIVAGAALLGCAGAGTGAGAATTALAPAVTAAGQGDGAGDAPSPPGAPGAPGAPSPPSPPSPIVIGQSFTLRSRVLGMPRKVNVYVPPSHASGARRYPVLYLLDGGEAQDFHHISGLAQLGTIAGTTAELIVVGIESVDRSHELTFATRDPRDAETWPTHGASATFRRHIADEVIPFVESRFRTSGDNALIGESLAGLFVVETFLREPALFDRYIAISPSLWWDAISLSDQAGALLAQHDDTARTLFLAMADEGGTMQLGMHRLVAALEASAPRALTWTYEARPEETHATIYHDAALDALRQLWGMSTHGAAPAPAQAWQLIAGSW